MLNTARAIPAIMLLAAPLVHAAAPDHLRHVNPGDPLPAFDCAGLGSQRVRSADLEGKVLVLVYVAAHQRQSDAAMTAAHEVVSGEQREETALVFMSADSDQQAWFRERQGVIGANEPFAFDLGRKFAGQIGLIVYPTTIVTKADGTLLHVIASWTPQDRRRLEVYVRHALGELSEAQFIEEMSTPAVVGDLASQRSASHRAAAAILRRQGQLAAATQELSRALSAAPTAWEAALDLADLHLATRNVAEAERLVADVLARHPDVPRAALLMGLIDIEEGRLGDAERRLLPLQNTYPDTVQVQYALGRLFAQKGDVQTAAEHYRLAAEAALSER